MPPVFFHRRGFTFPLLLALALLGAGNARAALVTLGVPAAAVPVGGTVRVELIVLNPSSEPVTYALPTVLDGRLTQGSRVWLVNLQGGAGDVTVAAGGFARLPLAFALPHEAVGRLVLELEQPVALRGLIEVSPTAATGGGAAGAEPLPSLRAADRLKRYYADHLSGHEPIYFVFGGGKPAAKFQFSFKYRLLNDSGALARRVPSLKGLHLAYTQRTLWDIRGDSSPFYDSSYMPELLFESFVADTGKHGGFSWLGYQAALHHESNGRAGTDSRSMNVVYFRPAFAFGDLDGWRLILRPKIFAYLGSPSDSRDLKRYRGYSELRTIFGKNNRLSVSLTGRVGDRFDHGSAQFDVSSPMEFLHSNFAMYLLAQYWTGYGESLLNYDQRSSTARFGFSLAR